MRHLVAWHVLVAGLVSFCTVFVPDAAVIAQEREAEHVLFQAIRRGDSTLLKGILRRLSQGNSAAQPFRSL